MKYQLDAAAEHIKVGSRDGINVNILNHKKKWPEAPLKSPRRQKNSKFCDGNSQLNTIHLLYIHDPNNVNGIHV